MDQRGILEGSVSDKKTKDMLIGAQVLIDGLNLSAQTSVDGRFKIANIAPGKYNIKVVYMAYEPLTIEGVEISPEHTNSLDAVLEPKLIALNAVSVNSRRKFTTEAGVLTAIKSSQAVVSGISAAQISKSQDRDASEVVKRIPGITIIDDRFIVVRGLSQRYNNVWLNNAPVPSSETDIRSFSFDVIPSGLIENILIYKNGVAELPADVAGGFIKITTKNLPDSNFFSIDLASSYHQGTTGKDFYSYKGGKTDWLGFDDGTRALPASMPANLEDPKLTDAEKNSYAKKMNQNFTNSSKTARPDAKFGITIGKRFVLKGITIGNTTALTYSNSLNTKNIENNSWSSYNLGGDSLVYGFKFKDRQYTNNVKTAILHNWSFVFSDKHRIEFKNLYNQIAFNRTTLRDGIDHYRSDLIVRSYEYQFMSRTTYAGQLDGTHSFYEGKTKLNWNVDYAYANRREPDRKMLLTSYDSIVGKYALRIPDKPTPEQTGRVFLNNEENIYSGGINIEQKINLTALKPILKLGYFGEFKNRSFWVRNFGIDVKGQTYDSYIRSIVYNSFDKIFTKENYNAADGFVMEESTKKSDAYTAANNQQAVYSSLSFNVLNKVNVVAGIRAENNQQILHSYKTGLDEKVDIDHQILDFFPSANISYNITEKSLVRAAYSRSVNRPEFREIAPLVYFDFSDWASYEGNDSLKNAYINNYDFRIESYPSAGETFSLAFFYKQFNNPIEVQFTNVGSGYNYTFKNAEHATSYGVEFEARKSLSFIPGFEKFTLVGNASLINSKVRIHTSGSYVEDRALQGQSPYILNTSLFYSNPELGLNISTSFFVMGPRIMVVGISYEDSNDNIPDVYEMPTKLLDLTISKKLGKWLEIKGGVKNILNDKETFQQTFKRNRNGESLKIKAINKQYKTGAVFNLGVSMKF